MGEKSRWPVEAPEIAVGGAVVRLIWCAAGLDIWLALLPFQARDFIPQALDFGSLGAVLFVQGLDLVHQGLDDRTQGRVGNGCRVKIIKQ
jgi:hypothetical protein